MIDWTGSTDLGCRVCGDMLTLQQYRRKSSCCDDCEFDMLITFDWLDEFLYRLKIWQRNKAL